MDLNNLSEAAAPAEVKGKPAPVEDPYEPKVHGESLYDRVTSAMISIVIGTSIIVGWLWLVYFANQAYAQKPVSPVEIVEVDGGGGGDPEGQIGGTGVSENVAGGEAGQQASNNMEDAGAYEEPQAQATSTATLDPYAPASDSDGEVADSASEVRSGGAVASGQRASRVGNGIMGLGPGGPGSGGVGRGQRWVFVAPPGQGESDYAKQLDFFGIELGTITGASTLTYASNFSGTPVTRTGLSAADKRMHVTWQGQGRRQFDMELLRKAGIQVGPNSIILQFLSDKAIKQIAQAEYNYKGRQPAEIAQTRFTVQPSGGGYAFVVLEQKTLR